MRTERISRRIEGKAHIQVAIVVRHIDRLEVVRAGKPGRILLICWVVLEGWVHVRRRYPGPVVEGTVDGNMLEVAGARLDAMCQQQAEGDLRELSRVHRDSIRLDFRPPAGRA